MRIDTAMTIGEIVRDYPQLSRVFERHGIDYCCGGKRRFEELTRERGIDPGALVTELEADLARGLEQQSWGDASPLRLIDHILEKHHRYLWEELPALERLANKVASVHGAAHPELVEVRDVFSALRTELEAHMYKEEQVLFPMMRSLVEEGWQEFHCGHIGNPIRVMEAEHEEAGEALARIRNLTRNYTLPDGACNSYRGLFGRLERLERDLHEHVHEENNILFPSILELRNPTSM